MASGLPFVSVFCFEYWLFLLSICLILRRHYFCFCHSETMDVARLGCLEEVVDQKFHSLFLINLLNIMARE